MSIKRWKDFLISTSVVAVVFLIWDALFTMSGIWGFNEEYCLGLSILMMPIEEWLFFFVIPFCSMFIHFALKHLAPNFFLSKNNTRKIAFILIAVTCLLLCTHFSKAYTSVDAIFFNRHAHTRRCLLFEIITALFSVISNCTDPLFYCEWNSNRLGHRFANCLVQ